MPDARNQRLLLFVIAYYAEDTLRQVLERVPPSVFEQFDCEILVVDDASEDRTFAIGREYKDSHPERRVTVLRNLRNQGYGGNQKVGYCYAIQEGFDFVALIHGDGQYAPEALPALLEPLKTGDADAVFGSRMLTRFGALRGGMPLYKFVGNRVLTFAQNRLLGTRLSEFHSGYRIYSVKALEQLHYQLNANGFHFDTAIIIQLLNARMRIRELPIPTYYGTEISRVNGLKYAWNVMLETVRNVFHRSFLLYQRRFDPKPTTNVRYDLKLGYASTHQWALDAVPAGSRVLDIGSGPGFALELARKGCEVAVVDRYQPPAADPATEVFLQDLNDPLTFPVRPYRYLLLLDIIEHLEEPERFIERLRAEFDYEPRTLIITTGNVAFFVVRLMLLAGQFNYGAAGILDRTHTRLFTFRTLRRLLRDAGFMITAVRGVPAPFPKVFGDGWLGKAALAVNLGLIRLSKTFFSYQIYMEADCTPSVEFVLRQGRETQA